MGNKVLIIVSGSFPYGTPRALRMRAFADLFKAIGWNVVVLSDYFAGEHSGKLFFEYENMELYSLGKELSGKNKLLIPLLFKKKFRDIIEKERPDLIYSYSLYDRFPFILWKAKKNGIPLVLDSNEWYHPSTFKFGRFSWHYILHSICWKWFYPKVDGIVAISRLIEKHYSKYTDHVIRIPTIVDNMNGWEKKNAFNDKKIHLLFAGSLAKTKDSIKEYYEALDYLGNDNDKIYFEICGVDKQELIEHLGEKLYNSFKKQTNMRGRIPQKKISEIYKKCDYGIFFRPDQRSSHAGFPTKLGEGMSNGTPFIVNNTGDISLYINNGINGFIVEDVQSIAAVYQEILEMSNEESDEMRSQAYKTAEKNFSYKPYIKLFDVFIQEVIGGQSCGE